MAVSKSRQDNDQPRDEDGRFTDKDGGKSGKGSSSGRAGQAASKGSDKQPSRGRASGSKSQSR